MKQIIEASIIVEEETARLKALYNLENLSIYKNYLSASGTYKHITFWSWNKNPTISAICSQDTPNTFEDFQQAKIKADNEEFIMLKLVEMFKKNISW